MTVVVETSMLWAQMVCEKQLETDIPTVIQGCIVAVLLEAVRIQWDDNYGILHTEKLCMSIVCRYILVCTLTSNVCAGIYQHEQSM